MIVNARDLIKTLADYEGEGDFIKEVSVIDVLPVTINYNDLHLISNRINYTWDSAYNIKSIYLANDINLLNLICYIGRKHDIK